jgi:hypothetical protein
MRVPQSLRKKSPLIIHPGGLTTVSTLTTLFSWIEIGQNWKVCLFAFANESETDTVSIILEPSEFEVGPDTDRTQTFDIEPRKEASFEIGPDSLRLKWRASAHTEGPGYPLAQVRHRVIGVSR